MSLKIATINVRGLNSLNKKTYLRDLLIENHIDIACIQEVKNPYDELSDENFKYILNIGEKRLGTVIIHRKKARHVSF